MSKTISQANLKSSGFEIHTETKVAIKYLNEEKSLAIFVKSDKSVWLNLDGFKCKTKIKTMEELEKFSSYFENHNVELPF